MSGSLRAALIDALALLEHYAEGRPLNWDGSTKRQALATVRQGRDALACPAAERDAALDRSTPKGDG